MKFGDVQQEYFTTEDTEFHGVFCTKILSSSVYSVVISYFLDISIYTAEEELGRKRELNRQLRR